MKKFLILLTLVLSGTAWAWGPREQGALAGLAAGYWLGQQQPQQQPYVVQPQPIYVTPPVPVYPRYYSPARPSYNLSAPAQSGCWTRQLYDQWGRPAGYQEVCQ